MLIIAQWVLRCALWGVFVYPDPVFPILVLSAVAIPLSPQISCFVLIIGSHACVLMEEFSIWKRISDVWEVVQLLCVMWVCVCLYSIKSPESWLASLCFPDFLCNKDLIPEPGLGNRGFSVNGQRKAASDGAQDCGWVPHWGLRVLSVVPRGSACSGCDEALSCPGVMLGRSSGVALQQPRAGSCLAAPTQLQSASCRWWPFLMLFCVWSLFILFFFYLFPSFAHIWHVPWNKAGDSCNVLILDSLSL